jgi:hypothetical protein
MNIDENLEFLIELGAKDTPHSGSTLFDHLLGTYEILVSVDAPADACSAGLFHSIYGTAQFKRSLLSLSDRDKLVSRIGEGAERLVMLFSLLERPRSLIRTVANDARPLEFVFGDVISVGDRSGDATISRKEFDNLLTIEAANLLDQRVLWEQPVLLKHAVRKGMLAENGHSKTFPRPTLISD